MVMNAKLNLLLILLITFPYTGFAQNEDVSLSLIGRKCPDFKFDVLNNFESDEAQLSDFIGKPLIIDFWASWCVPCIKEFPRLDSLQNRFGDRIQILPVAWDNQKNAMDLFSSMLKRKILSFQRLPAAFDTILVKKINAGKLISIWIDKNGIIRYYTSSNRITENTIEMFLKGNKIEKFENLISEHRATVARMHDKGRSDDRTEMVTHDDASVEANYLYRSFITPYLPELGYKGVPVWLSPKKDTVTYKLINLPLQTIYELAYRPLICPNPIMSTYNTYGNFAMYCILDMQDPSEFQFTWNHKSDSVGTNRFCYQLKLPRRRGETHQNLDSAKHYANPVTDSTDFKMFGAPDDHSIKMQRILQQDLYNYFGYKVSIERRKFPVFYLEAEKGAARKLKTKGSAPSIIKNGFGFIFTNQPISALIGKLWFAKQIIKYSQKDNVHQYTGNVVIDNTNFGKNIDIEINCDLEDFSAVNKELGKYGLALRLGEREMAVIVIRDK